MILTELGPITTYRMAHAQVGFGAHQRRRGGIPRRAGESTRHARALPRP